MRAMRVMTRKSGRMPQADHDLSPGRWHEALAAWECAHSVSLTAWVHVSLTVKLLAAACFKSSQRDNLQTCLPLLINFTGLLIRCWESLQRSKSLQSLAAMQTSRCLVLA
jgi:hypothetical protein